MAREGDSVPAVERDRARDIVDRNLGGNWFMNIVYGFLALLRSFGDHSDSFSFSHIGTWISDCFTDMGNKVSVRSTFDQVAAVHEALADSGDTYLARRADRITGMSQNGGQPASGENLFSLLYPAGVPRGLDITLDKHPAAGELPPAQRRPGNTPPPPAPQPSV